MSILKHRKNYKDMNLRKRIIQHLITFYFLFFRRMICAVRQNLFAFVRHFVFTFFRLLLFAPYFMYYTILETTKGYVTCRYCNILDLLYNLKLNIFTLMVFYNRVIVILSFSFAEQSRSKRIDFYTAENFQDKWESTPDRGCGQTQRLNLFSDSGALQRLELSYSTKLGIDSYIAIQNHDRLS